jgi:PKD repeat protein
MKITFIIFLFSINLLIAQTNHKFICGSDSLSNRILNEDSPSRNQYINLEKQFRNQYKGKKKLIKGAKRIIPVVVHIFHEGFETESNISDEQIESAIEQATKDFNLNNSDTNEILPIFKPIAGKMNIEFRLAKTDPEGNCSSGITRHYFPGLTKKGGELLKARILWNPKKYLNIWVCDSMAAGFLAYSYLPNTAPNNDLNAGIVIRHDYFGTIGTVLSSEPYAKMIFTHEIGHYLGLKHTWGYTNYPNIATNCDDDDDINDTPNTIGTDSCNLSFPSCDGGIANVQNYMSYSKCSNMFTQGQVQRVFFFLDSHTTGLAPRNNLWQDSNLLATGTIDGFNEIPCSNTPYFETKTRQICEGESILFDNRSYGNSKSNYFWEFEGGNPSSSSDSNPIITFEKPGIYSVKLTSSNSENQKEITREKYLLVTKSNTGYIDSLKVDFESPIFINEPSKEKSWFTKSTFSTISSKFMFFKISKSGITNNSVRVRTKTSNNTINTSITSPTVQLSGKKDSLFLVFDRAYIKLKDISKDQLKIYISPDCGLTWNLEKILGDSTLPTKPGFSNMTFIPEKNDWKKTTINLSKEPYLNSKNLHVRFELEGSQGNYLYLDNINLISSRKTKDFKFINQELEIYPNPIIKEKIKAVLHLNTNTDFHLKIIDVLGRKIYSSKKKGIKGKNNIEIENTFNNGLFWMEITTQEGRMIKKFQIL